MARAVNRRVVSAHKAGLDPVTNAKFGIIGAIGGAIGGFVTGGPAGAAAGFIGGGFGGGNGKGRAAAQPPMISTPLVESFKCPPGTFKVPGFNRCADLQPGGATQGAGLIATAGEAVVGAFGQPARLPTLTERVVRRCPRGMVLGMDELCYPKATLQRRAKWRKWRQPARPPISRSDLRALEVRHRTIEAIAELNKKAGLRVPTEGRKKAATSRKKK